MDVWCAILLLCVSLLLIRVRDSVRLWSFFNFFPSQAVVLLMAGKHVGAMMRMDNFITGRADWAANPALHVVQARKTCPHVQ